MVDIPHSFIRFVEAADGEDAKEALLSDDSRFEAGKTYYLVREDPRPELHKLRGCNDEDLAAFLRGFGKTSGL